MAIEKVIQTKTGADQGPGEELVAPARLSERESSKDLSQDELKQRAKQVHLLTGSMRQKELFKSLKEKERKRKLKQNPKNFFQPKTLLKMDLIY